MMGFALLNPSYVTYFNAGDRGHPTSDPVVVEPRFLQETGVLGQPYLGCTLVIFGDARR